MKSGVDQGSAAYQMVKKLTKQQSQSQIFIFKDVNPQQEYYITSDDFSIPFTGDFAQYTAYVSITLKQDIIDTDYKQGDQLALTGHTYNGETGKIWYGVIISYSLNNDPYRVKVKTGTAALIVDETNNIDVSSIPWFACELNITVTRNLFI